MFIAVVFHEFKEFQNRITIEWMVIVAVGALMIFGAAGGVYYGYSQIFSTLTAVDPTPPLLVFAKTS